jgi:hypothetical protein
MKTLVKNFTLLLLMLCAGSLSAQNFYKNRISRDNILTIGFGPSFAYLDNGGHYRALDFKIEPSISVSLTKKLNPTFDIRSTMGYQNISSGGSPNIYVQDNWSEKSSAFTAKGPVYYLDLMPSMNIMKFTNHMNRSMVNLYGGFGIGVLHSKTAQTKSFSTEEVPTTHKVTTGYVPIRAGLSFKLGPYSDIAGEGTILWTFTDNLDGNVGFNSYGDVLFQAQIVYRRYLLIKEKD